MLHKYNIDEIAEQYCQNKLSSEEKKQIEDLIAQDIPLKREWDEAIGIYHALNHAADVAHIKTVVENIQNKPELSIGQKTIKFFKHNWKNTAVAASLFVAALSTYNYFDTTNKFGNRISQFTQLSREVEHIKVSQNNLKKSIEVNQKAEEASGVGGTGFAISNDGYIATNYHVISNSNNIYVTTHDNTTHPAALVGYDAVKDIAILKVVADNFKFSTKNLPYSIMDKQDKVLGAKIFSIGYPQDNLVYNEGYISAERGYLNDSTSYQLEIVSNPGQSGSPVLDKNGNVLGLITGKNSNTSGMTYAVQSKALLTLIKNLPEHITIQTPKQNSLAKLDRTEQVHQLKNYVVTIKSAQ